MRESRFGRELREEGRLEGQLEMGRSAILGILEERFSAAARQQFEAGLNAIDDLDQLRKLLRLAVTVPDLHRFRAGS
jgi:hypothetical protein